MTAFVPPGFQVPECFEHEQFVLRPLLISGRAQITALAVFVGVLGGIPAFGAIGVILGPVVLSLVLALIEFAEESRPQNS